MDKWHGWHENDQDELIVTYSRLTEPVLPLREALRRNAQATVDSFPGEEFALMFSGGLDSELMVRAFMDIGHPFKAYCFKYDSGYNSYDVAHATGVAAKLGIELNVLDFNITHFYENDALDFMDTIECSHARALVQPLFIERVDGVPLYGTGDPRFYRPHGDYSQKTEWLVQDNEYEIAWADYAKDRGRKAEMQWLRHTPHFVASIMDCAWFRDLTEDKYIGKEGVNSTKIEGYWNAYPDMVKRIKQTGFEDTDHLVLPVQKEHNKRHMVPEGGAPPWGRTCERTVSQLRKDLWGTFDN